MSPGGGYRLRPLARDDLLGIGRFTRLRWARDQQNRYLNLLRERMDMVARNPFLGADRDDISRGLGSLPVGRHLIFYRMVDDGVLVVRILHDAMDVEQHLKGEERGP